jgi:uncharacterized protein YndB with AHSA1/START domain/DNA-binding transcriptional ArsR family regulator
VDETTPVFRALADPHRRLLLDRLHERDGQTLGELCTHLPEMTRFGCMKHLRVLEEAGLVSSRKVGREKFHYLNPVPIQQLYDRWVGKFARPWTRTLTGLKAFLEEDQMDHAPTHVYEIFIRTTPDRIWQALTDPEITQQYYFFGSRVESDWQPGSPYTVSNPVGGTVVQGEVLEADPLRRLVMTWRATFADIPTTTVTWTIEPIGDSCKLTLQHSDLDPATPVGQGIASAWAQLLSSLKSLLETGQPLNLG